jgi:hypothetical protein
MTSNLLTSNCCINLKYHNEITIGDCVFISFSNANPFNKIPADPMDKSALMRRVNILDLNEHFKKVSENLTDLPSALLLHSKT